MSANSEVLNLSIGDRISDARLARQPYSGVIDLHGKQVFIDVSADALRACMDSARPIICEVELYFSCLVRKQVRFREMSPLAADEEQYARVVPGFFAGFRAVATQHCRISDVGDKPPVETMPIQKPERFVPDWIKVDYRAGQWIGEYGFKRTL